MKKIKEFFKKMLNDWAIAVRANDPLYSCEVFKERGCSHLDGYLCDMRTCDIRKRHIEVKKESIKE